MEAADADSLVVPAAVLEAVIAYARSVLPAEAVGYLAGAGNVVSHLLPVRNELDSPTAFRTDPRDALAAHKAMRAAGVDLLAVTHSHPTTDAVPSRHDLAGNPYGDAVVWLIVGLAWNEPDVRAWRLTDTGFHAVTLVVSAASEPVDLTLT